MLQKVHFRLTSVAQKRCCLSSLIIVIIIIIITIINRLHHHHHFISGVNAWDVGVVRYSVGIVDWTVEELVSMNRKILTP